MRARLTATLVAALFAMMLVATGCSSSQLQEKQAASTIPDDKKEWAELGTVQIVNDTGEQGPAAATAANAKQLAKNFYEFNKAAYDSALKEGKIVFLNFYANWCPICKAEEPAIKAAFDGLDAADAGKVVGFRVNYNDDKTDADEKALAKKFGITYQHTKIVIAPDEKVVSRTLEAQSKQEVLDQIKDSIK